MFPLDRTMRSLLLGVLTGVVVSCSAPTAESSRTSSTEPSDTTAAPRTTTQPSTTTPATTSPSRVLVFHKTEGFRHDSIEAGIQALEEAGEGYEVTSTEDASVFTSDGLAPLDVIVFLNTTGDVLDEAQQSEMEAFIRAGKGFVGIHSAADTEYDWGWYEGLVGAYFDSHPEPQSASIEITSAHPVVEGLPEQFERFDEWYNFRAQPGPGATILAFLDESTYEGGAMGESHPIVWAQEYDGGRAVYIGFGHTPETFDEPLVLNLLGKALDWAGGRNG